MEGSKDLRPQSKPWAQGRFHIYRYAFCKQKQPRYQFKCLSSRLLDSIAEARHIRDYERGRRALGGGVQVCLRPPNSGRERINGSGIWAE
jgi:hypothetical protein